MQTAYATLPDLVIAAGGTHSQVFNGWAVYHDATGLQLYSPATLPESVYFEVNQNAEATNSSAGWMPYETFDIDGASINLFVPSAGKSQTYQEPIYAGSFRLTAGSAVAADRIFKINKIWST